MLSENATKIAEARYFLEGETWEECAWRVAKVVGSVEKDKSWVSLFAQMIHDMNFLPAGRILRNCGRPRGSLFNCYVVSVGDSIEEIGQCYKDALILWSEGGGVGINFSTLRPADAPILGKGGKSSGMVSFITAADSVAGTIESGGARRAAGLIAVDVSHPEVLDVIDAKLEDGRISHFNISIGVTDEFLQAVEADQDWEFSFQQKTYGKMKARKIWQKILKNMIVSAEPGLINFSNLRKNNSHYFAPIQSTNPCGEAPLDAYGSCCLGSLTLPNFILGQGRTHWKKMEETIRFAVRFLDNIIDVNKYVLTEIDLRAHQSRRIGLGVMGLAEYLFSKEVRYGSGEALYEVERVMKFIRDTVYTTLVELAIEKGSFPAFDPLMYGQASFIRKLPASIRRDIKAHGTRCVTGLAIAPTGTISLLPEVSSGCEPLFSKAHMRKDRVGERLYVHPLFREFTESGKKIPAWYVDAFDLKPEDHFEMQAMMQRYVDGSVSKTINLPAGTKPGQLGELLQEYLYELKGCTVYVDGSKQGQILNRVSEEDVAKKIKSGELCEVAEEQMCANGKCDL